MIEDDGGCQQVGRHAQLNPVRVKRLGLDKGQRSPGRVGLEEQLSNTTV
jgi:hypothetical protein